MENGYVTFYAVNLGKHRILLKTLLSRITIADTVGKCIRVSMPGPRHRQSSIKHIFSRVFQVVCDNVLLINGKERISRLSRNKW